MEVYLKSDIGLVRTSNQDACKCGSFSDQAVWAVVCDGMGGANGGNVASEVAVETVAQLLMQEYDKALTNDQTVDLLTGVVQRANSKLYEMQKADQMLRGMGTTIELVLVKENKADGCGLSNYNYISPELLVSFLRYAYSRTDVFQKLYKALPIGGVDGTLEFRMKKGTLSHRNVHAKTGSFTAINCLAGYLKARNGHEIAFAIMNQNALSGREARAFQDAVCDEMIR